MHGSKASSKLRIVLHRAASYGLVLLTVGQLVMFPVRAHADSGTWIDGGFPALTVNKQLADASEPASCFPTTFTYWSYTKPNGSYDSVGRPVDVSVCATENPLGYFGGSGYYDDYGMVRPNTATAFQVFDVRLNASAVTPVPNQPVFITKDSSQSFHGEVAPHFYDSFPAAGTFGPANSQLAFTVTKPGTILTDSAGTKIYMHAHAFSRNGQWMVIEARGLGLIRVNTITHSMQLFDQLQLSYGFGYAPQMTLAISDDGNTVIKSGKDASDTWAYDLSACTPGSFKIGADNSSAMQGCRKRALQTSLRLQLSGFTYLTAMHFNADGNSLSAVAVRAGVLGQQDYFAVTYSVAGYVASQLDYLALGDSFSSGEGAYDYVPGTDNDNPKNKCHLSTLSYPYLTAQALGITDFHSVACSGALYDPNYKAKAQFDNEPSFVWLAGEDKQQYFVSMAKPTVVTISMIGNDVGFKDKLVSCLEPGDCFHFKEEREMIANEFYNKFDDLVSLYQDIKSSAGNTSVKVYVLGYPQILGSDSCQINVPFSLEERQMAQSMIGYLNAVIKAATIKAGVQYIDVEHAFDGYRLCDTYTSGLGNLSSAAVNGLTRGDDVGPISNGSFHPDALGHQLLSQALIAQSQSFSVTMPAVNNTVTAPYIGSDVYNRLIGDAPSANLQGLLYTSPLTLVNRVTLTATDTIVKSAPLVIHEESQLLKPYGTYQVSMHSDPVRIGDLTADVQGHLEGDVTLPDNLTSGYHTLHITGKDVGGNDVDMYQEVYVASSMDDFNGDGVPNSADPCLVVPASGIDSDRDGIDDACDGDITPLPADTTSPSVIGVPDRQPDHNGWYNHDVTVTWTTVDPDPSSGTPTQPAPTLVSSDGEGVYNSGQSCDPAGNCASGSIDIKHDKTAPNITFTIDPEPNALGWNNSAATVHFACTDETSGIESCTSPVTVSGSDGSYVVTGAAVDNAGNPASVNVVVNLDATVPGLTNNFSSESNQNNWYNSDVTVTSTCSDNLSGVALCSPAATLTAEGVGQLFESYAVDNAGNSAAMTNIVNIDKTAPTISSLSWTNNPKATLGIATLFVPATDNLSGVASAEYFLGDVDPGLGTGAALQKVDEGFTATFGTDFPTGVYKVSVRVQDKAGNWSAPASDYLVVYNPFGVRMMGKRTVVPSLSAGDILPGLVSAIQTDAAKFAFSVGYDSQGRPFANDLQFIYDTGNHCRDSKKAQNCHTFQLNATSVDWFVTSGLHDSTGLFEGKATLVIDGVAQQVGYVLTGIDGELLDDSSSDHLTLRIFAEGDNPMSAQPLYQVNQDVARGNIHIKT